MEKKYYPNPKWQPHKTKNDKWIRTYKYNLLRELGYCPGAANRAKDFRPAKWQKLVDEFNVDFNNLMGGSK